MPTELPPVHIGRIREPVQMWREDHYRPSLERTLRNLVLRDVDRAGGAFDAPPVQTVHLVSDMGPEPMILADAPSQDEPLTDEQIVELPDNAWVEIRLTVPIRALEQP